MLLAGILSCTVLSNCSKIEEPTIDNSDPSSTHILYPGLHDRTKVESTFTKFRLRESKNFEGFNGQGLLDGSEAAVKAFVNYR